MKSTCINSINSSSSPQPASLLPPSTPPPRPFLQLTSVMWAWHNSSVDKGTCSWAWQPELDTWNSHGRENQVPRVVLWLYICAVHALPTHIAKYSNDQSMIEFPGVQIHAEEEYGKLEKYPLSGDWSFPFKVSILISIPTLHCPLLSEIIFLLIHISILKDS